MIHWMLTRLEKNPHALFEEWELKRRDPAAFDALKREGLVQRLPTPRAGESYVDPSGRLLTVVANPDGTLEAIDEDDPECDPIELAPQDFTSWRLDREALAKRIQEANGLRGSPGRLHDRLFFLGEGERNGVKVSFVLGLLHEPRSAQTILLSLPNLLPATSHRLAVLCPTFAPAPSDLRQLDSLSISVIRLADNDPLLLDDLAIWQVSGPDLPSEKPSGNTFRKEGEYWSIGDQERVFRLRDTKSLRYIACLLRHPGREFSVLDLVAVVGGTRHQSEASTYARMTTDQLADEGLAVSEGERSEPLLDAQARSEYMAAIRDLQEDVDEAERNNDFELAANFKEQRDSIIEHLRTATGLGGRERGTPSPAERARINVTKQIGRALDRIEKEHGLLARHLRNSIRTGAFCIYSPETPTDWVL